MSRPFLVPTGELFRHPGARQRVSIVAPLSGVALSSARVTGDDVRADLTLEAQGAAVIVSGVVSGRWAGECRRCLGPTGGEIVVDVREVFEPHPVEGETYGLGRDDLDLEPALREALALALPLAPLCDEACRGPDSDDHPVTVEDDAGDARARPTDPRWAALDSLRFDQ